MRKLTAKEKYCINLLFRIALVLPLVLPGWAAPGAEAPSPRRLDIPCDFVVPDGFQARCGRVFLPENRTAPTSGTVILPVVTLSMPAKRRPNTAPILYLAGGPGHSSGLDRDAIPYWFDVIKDSPGCNNAT